MENNCMIYELIGKAMAEIGAIGKDSTNAQQGFKYRGIDAVYNALNPVMAKYGLFITPEILDHKREERTTTKTYNGQTKTSTLLYSIITVRYTVYAPDGSNVQITVIGEGMDSGDKATNKAMSIAMKYAMFQLYMIPTEAVDPDSECHDIDPNGQNVRPEAPAEKASVTVTSTMPPAAKPAPNPNPMDGELPGAFIKRRIAEIKAARPDFNFMEARAGLIQGGVIEDIPSATMNMVQAKALMDAIAANIRKAG